MVSKAKEPIRILQYIGGLEAGGSQAMIMNIYRNIDRSKIQFDFVVDRKDSLFYKDEIESLGGKVYIFDEYFKGYNYLGFTKQWKDFFKKHSEYKIIHCHVRSVASIVLKIAKKNGLKTICHSHSISNGKGVKAIAKKVLQSKIKKYCDYYFACSEESAKWLYGDEILKDKNCVVLKNAIDVDKYVFNKKVRDDVRKTLNLEDKIILGQIGRLEKVKNHVFSLELLKKILEKDSRYFLLIVGTGSLKDLIIKKAESLGVSENVMILENRNDIPELLQAMDVFIMPSLYEGLPLSLVEAQAADLPCVVSNNVSDGILIKKNVKQLSLNDIGEWEKYISKISLNVNTRKSSIEKIRETGFDVKNSSQKMLDFYERILNRKKFLFITDTRYESGKLTGGHKRFLELVKGTVKKNDVILISRKIPGLKKDNIEFFEIVNDKRGILPFHVYKIFILCKILRKEKRNIKYDYAISFGPIDTFCYGIVGYKNIVMLLREDFVGYRKALGVSNMKLAYFKFMERYAVKHSSKIIVQCTDDKDALIRRCGTRNKKLESMVYVQINNINTSWISSDRKCESEKNNDSVTKIIFIGNFADDRKGHQILLPAVKKLIDDGYNIRLNVVGDGKLLNLYKEEYKDYKNIVFLGRANDVGNLLAESDFEIVPSLMDSCPNTVLEGINAGIAVYGTNIGGIKEILEDRKYLFEPNVDSVYNFIRYVMKDKRYIDDALKQKPIKDRLTFDWVEKIENIINSNGREINEN